MANETRGSLLLRPKFLLFCLYVAGYLVLRGYGQIQYQSAEVRGLSGIGREYIVGADRSLPRWQRQCYRAFFSPLMVAEEECRRLADQGLGAVDDAGDIGGKLFGNG